MRSKRKPYNDKAGYVCSLRSGPYLSNEGRRGWVVVYDTTQIDSGDWGGRWIASCETHGIFMAHTSQRGARATMKCGSEEFCEECNPDLSREQY